MFKFSKVEDQRSGKTYIVTKAVFAGDEYDRVPDGLNWYHVGLDPEDVDEVPFPSVDVITSNNGYIQISRNLHGKRYEKRFDELLNISVDEAIMVKAIIDGDMLIIPEEDNEEESPIVFHEVCEAAELKHLTDSRVYLVGDAKVNGTMVIRVVFKWPAHEQELRIQENGTLLLSDLY